MEAVIVEEEFTWREVNLPSAVTEPELERDTGLRRRDIPRDILIAIDHDRNSRQAFEWALIHLCRPTDTIHLVHAVSSVRNEELYLATQALMEKLSFEAAQAGVGATVARIVKGDAGKVICWEAERLLPAAVVMGSKGKSIVRSVLRGSVSEYCFKHCKVSPVVIVPEKKLEQETTSR
ncbi:hypothetical protein HS088_TW07G01310 [Tripterygium wilfordii]|uniref:UspA domain-containing protein n=1 Tax=Tripterygium wilfordii TaxID=458696 RepID=A0A7J7DHE1_TRIWF|nr:universal stress protein PHOS32 [Tripterygium wilfordii]KAF5745718.1 hypothetical protein HS088_TW07G01310 [Tripterygium wilfordii]